jgi:amidophosphoribosyltransferase
MPSRSELVAFNRTTEDIAKAIGADLVIFQSLPSLIQSVRQFNPSIKNFDCSVFTGDYVTGGVDEAYLSSIEMARSDNARGKGLNALDGMTKTEHMNVLNPPNGDLNHQVTVSTSGPINGPGDDTVGLHNSYNIS